MSIISYFFGFVLVVGLIFILLPYFKSYFKPKGVKKPFFINPEEFSQEVFPHQDASMDYAWKGNLKKIFPTPELPQNYHDHRLTLMVKNPNCLYAYWEISESALIELGRLFPGDGTTGQLVLRVFRVIQDQEHDQLHHLFDIDIKNKTNNWFIDVPNDNAHYCVELGVRLPNGDFMMLLRSAVVTTPRSSISTVIDENWIPCNIYGPLDNFLYGISSPDLFKKKERTET